ncbi:MAG: hypothetical protein Q9204_004785 [Flavoplaca sp. TL-2023a]
MWGDEELFNAIFGKDLRERLRGSTSTKRDREQIVLAFEKYLELKLQVNDTSLKIYKDRLTTSEKYVIEVIDESDIDTFIELLGVYCPSVIARGALRISSAFVSKLGNKHFRRDLRDAQGFRLLEGDESCRSVLDELLHFDA